MKLHTHQNKNTLGQVSHEPASPARLEQFAEAVQSMFTAAHSGKQFAGWHTEVANSVTTLRSQRRPDHKLVMYPDHTGGWVVEQQFLHKDIGAHDGAETWTTDTMWAPSGVRNIVKREYGYSGVQPLEPPAQPPLSERSIQLVMTEQECVQSIQTLQRITVSTVGTAA